MVRPARVDEAPLPQESPIPYALRVARAKAQATERTGAELVLAADSIVVLDGEILGKPSRAEDAVATLSRLSGREHHVHTAVVVIGRGGVAKDVVTTAVRFRTLRREELERYVESGEPMDKAGAYGIQGLGGALVAHVVGSYTNVVGLPLEESLRLLELSGFHT